MRGSLAPAAILGTAASVAAVGCLETIEPPAPTPQATVRFKDRLFLADEDADFCRNLYAATSTSLDDLTALDGSSSRPGTPAEAYNCNVRVETTGALPVDIHEVTNLQYQLCVDSGACSNPDPSKVEPTNVCVSTGGFDDCPVVDVSPGEAEDYCEWTGRRLPSGLESVLIRQSGTPDRADGLPESVPLLPHTDTLPVTCDDAVLANGDCDRPAPIEAEAGAAEFDALTPVAGKGQGTIYDLTGNAAELLADLEPSTRGTTGVDLPWFCVAPLPASQDQAGLSADNPPVCPLGTACVYGTYLPFDGAEVGEYPVCIAPAAGTIAGRFPVLSGASFFDELRPDKAGTNGTDVFSAREAAGFFAHRPLTGTEADDVAGSEVGRRVGFRCVGQRASVESGRPPPFTDRLMLVTSTSTAFP